MAATLRELRGRIRSAGSIKKITKAQELIATSRIGKAQARVEAARPYSTEITNMLTELASASALDHPLLVPREGAKRAGVLVVSSDRGLCGAYNANVLRQAEELFSLLREEGKNPVLMPRDGRHPNAPETLNADTGAADTKAGALKPAPDTQELEDAYSKNDPGVETKD